MQASRTFRTGPLWEREVAPLNVTRETLWKSFRVWMDDVENLDAVND